MKNRFFILIVLCSILFGGNGCRKEKASQLNCTGFKQAVLLNDVDEVRKSMAGLLGNYSEENINKLAAAIATQCNVAAMVDCFECIKTLPPQTEIIISFSHNGSPVQQRLDISYSPANKMTVVGLHN